MKTASLFFTGIITLLSLHVFAQITQQRELSGFTGVSLDTFADVYITPGSETAITVKADEHVIDKVITEVRNGVLYISTKGKIRNVEVLDVYIKMNKIDLIKVNGSGDLYCSGDIQANGLRVKLEGSGDVEIGLEEVKNVKVTVNGSGDISLQNVSGNFSASVAGSGDLEVDHVLAERCILSLSGSGDAEMEGSCVDLTISIMGSGDLDAGRLKAVNADVEIMGSGNCVVKVANSLSAKLNGSGDLVYYGNPAKVNAVANGSGEVYRR
jgi:hypothetical protein